MSEINRPSVYSIKKTDLLPYKDGDSLVFDLRNLLYEHEPYSVGLHAFNIENVKKISLKNFNNIYLRSNEFLKEMKKLYVDSTVHNLDVSENIASSNQDYFIYYENCPPLHIKDILTIRDCYGYHVIKLKNKTYIFVSDEDKSYYVFNSNKILEITLTALFQYKRLDLFQAVQYYFGIRVSKNNVNNIEIDNTLSIDFLYERIKLLKEKNIYLSPSHLKFFKRAISGYKEIFSPFQVVNLTDFLDGFSADPKHNQRVTTFLYDNLYCPEKIDLIGKYILNRFELYALCTMDLEIPHLKELREAILENPNEFFDAFFNNPSIIECLFENFESIYSSNTSNKGKQKQLKVTWDTVLNFHNNVHYGNVQKGDKPLANYLWRFIRKQEAFDIAKEVLARAVISAPNNIFDIKNVSKKEIESEQKKQVKHLTGVGENSQFGYDWLVKKDFENLVLGKECNCCSHIIGAGSGLVNMSITHHSVQSLAIKRDGQTIAKGTIFINRAQKYGIVNTIEINEELPESYYDDVYTTFMKGIEAFVKEYNKTNTDRKLEKIVVGGSSNLDLDLIRLHQKQQKILSGPNYNKFCVGTMGRWNTDSNLEQFIIYDASKAEPFENVLKT